MFAASPVASPAESLVNHASPHALVLARRADTDDLGETIAALAARLHAATYELLVLLREFDERSGWNNGFLSCAHWLHWRTGIDLGAAREKVRVSKALPALPRISMAMQHGQVSYAKVRALTRVATADNEKSLLDLALAGNCAHVERVVRAWRRVDRVQAARETEARHLQRQLSTWVDDDGMVVSVDGSPPRWVPWCSAPSRPRPTGCSARRAEHQPAMRWPRTRRPRNVGPTRWRCSPNPP
jgi:hypothetical protein